MTTRLTLTGSPVTVAPRVSPVRSVSGVRIWLTVVDGHAQPPRENKGTRRPLEPNLRNTMFFGLYSRAMVYVNYFWASKDGVWRSEGPGTRRTLISAYISCAHRIKAVIKPTAQCAD